jgi:FkbM family methyltransferase
MEFFNHKFVFYFRYIWLSFKALVFRDARAIEFKRWFHDDGDKTLRMDYFLNKESVVFDLGGYIGDFADGINKRYCCQIYVFEPMPVFFTKCLNRFSNFSNIKIYPFGLASKKGMFPISVSANGSSISLIKKDGPVIDVFVESIVDFINSENIDRIDLFKINIEGGEYDVLPALISSGLIKRVDNLQIQFHDFIPNAERMRDDIRMLLLETHNETWCYKFVWENWKRKY